MYCRLSRDGVLQKLCLRKEFGGLDFHHLYFLNEVMLAKQAWSLMARPNALANRIIKARNYPREVYCLAQLGSNPSLVWRSIWSVRHILERGCRLRIGNGLMVNCC